MRFKVLVDVSIFSPFLVECFSSRACLSDVSVVRQVIPPFFVYKFLTGPRSKILISHNSITRNFYIFYLLFLSPFHDTLFSDIKH